MFANALITQGEYQYLNDLALQAGADKSSVYHNYTEAYSVYFAPLKDTPVKFLEIGIYKGASVKLWENYFKKGELHFIDITLGNVEYFSKTAQYHLVNQESPRELEAFVQKVGGDFDIIIDDGGHTMQQQITSFKSLFPHVKSGGVYVIEDLHTSYWRNWPEAKASQTTIAYLKSLIDDLNYVGQKTTRASHINISASNLPDLTYFKEHIHSMHFYDSLVFIFKR